MRSRHTCAAAARSSAKRARRGTTSAATRTPRIPGAGLDEVFGAREKELRSPEAVTFTGEKDLDGPLAPLAGRTFNGRGICRAPRGHGAIDARAGALSGGRKRSRRSGDRHVALRQPGRAILIGTFPSAAFEQQPETMRANGELLQRLVASAGVVPEIRIDGAPGLVEARFLESSGAMLLIAINHADTPQKVTFAFGPDVPEAIWQNMESGAAVNFVQSRPGRPTRMRSRRATSWCSSGARGCGRLRERRLSGRPSTAGLKRVRRNPRLWCPASAGPTQVSLKANTMRFLHRLA